MKPKHLFVLALFAFLLLPARAGANKLIDVKVGCSTLSGAVSDFHSGTKTIDAVLTVNGTSTDLSPIKVFVQQGRPDTPWSFDISKLTKFATADISASVHAFGNGDDATATASATEHCVIAPPTTSTTVENTTTTTSPAPTTTTVVGNTTTTQHVPPATQPQCIPPNSEPDACNLPRTGPSHLRQELSAVGLLLLFGIGLWTQRPSRKTV